MSEKKEGLQIGVKSFVTAIVVIFVLIKFTPLKKLHPICFIALAAVVGLVFKM